MAPLKLVITGPAQKDLSDIRSYSVKTHGLKTANAYDALIKQALKDLVDDPFRPGSRDREDISGGLRSYHLSLSRQRSTPRINTPRHFILYFLPTDHELVISRILHEARDLERYMPDYKTQ